MIIILPVLGASLRLMNMRLKRKRERIEVQRERLSDISGNVYSLESTLISVNFV